jgi:hypothetical protein
MNLLSRIRGNQTDNGVASEQAKAREATERLDESLSKVDKLVNQSKNASRRAKEKTDSVDKDLAALREKADVRRHLDSA